MDELSLAALKPGESLTSSLYHRTGTLLFRAGHVLRQQDLDALKAANIHRLYARAEPADLALLKKRTGLYPLSIDALKVNHPLPQDICNDHGVILLSRNHIFHAEYRDALTRCNIRQVWTTSAESLRELDAFTLACSKCAADALDRELDGAPPMPTMPLDHPPFLERLTRLIHRTPEIRNEITNLRTDTCGHAQVLLRTLREAGTVKADIHQIVDRVIVGFTRDANFLLKLAALVQQETLDEDPRADHLINVCLNALAIGAQLKYSENQMRLLGIASFLHDIGLIRISSDILLKPGPLAQPERHEVDRHPVFALDLLEKIPYIPGGISLPIYQSHERVDGSGYPKGRRPPWIHEFARIIAIADAYAAICSPRTYRAALSPHDAISQVITMAGRNAFDKNITRAFLHAVGLFPIGSWVLLSSGETARVVSPASASESGDTARYDRPVVAILYDRSGEPMPFPTTLELSTRPDLTVAEVLPTDAFSPQNNLGF